MTTEARPRRSDATRSAILAAARERFAADGYDRATIRAIAAAARIDPSMVMRYYGSKEGLFAAAAEFELGLPDFGEVPREEVGARAAAYFLERWEDDDSLQALLRVGVTNEAAAARLRFASKGEHSASEALRRRGSGRWTLSRRPAWLPGTR